MTGELLKPPTPTRPLLPKPLRIIPFPNLQRLIARPQPSPIILLHVAVVHEQRPVRVREDAVAGIVVDDATEAVVEALVGGVDFVVIGGEAVGEVEFEDYVVLVCGKVDEVLFVLLATDLGVVWGGGGKGAYSALFFGFLGDGSRHGLEGH